MATCKTKLQRNFENFEYFQRTRRLVFVMTRLRKVGNYKARKYKMNLYALFVWKCMCLFVCVLIEWDSHLLGRACKIEVPDPEHFLVSHLRRFTFVFFFFFFLWYSLLLSNQVQTISVSVGIVVLWSCMVPVLMGLLHDVHRGLVDTNIYWDTKLTYLSLRYTLNRKPPCVIVLRALHCARFWNSCLTYTLRVESFIVYKLCRI